MSEALMLGALFADGCVLQQERPVAIWGMGRPTAEILVQVGDASARCVADDRGHWRVCLQALPAGGPFAMRVSDGISLQQREVYVGEVLVCAGQSNMEFTMFDVRHRYSREWEKNDVLLRHCKVPVAFDFHQERDWLDEVRWFGASHDHLGEFSAIGYWVGCLIRQWLHVPVGILNISLGGSPIESWMSEGTLRSIAPQSLQELAPYRDDAELERRVAHGLSQVQEWYDELHLAESDAMALSHDARWSWRSIHLPSVLCESGDVELRELRGAVYLRREISLPQYVQGCPGLLTLGTMVDSDVTFVNGVRVGESAHQYVSREYEIPAGVLHAGNNEILVRLVCERGTGRVTPGKRLSLVVDGETYDLEGTWSYAIGARATTIREHRTSVPGGLPAEVAWVQDCDCPGQDFAQWRPVGLYNAMLAPCAGYGVRCVLWYQGESNTGNGAKRYGDLLKAMIGDWRSAWQQDDLPFLIVQLPIFSIDSVEDGGWAIVRDCQQRVANEVDGVTTVVTLDAGEWNDLHPTNKRLVAQRLFTAMRRSVYGDVSLAQAPYVSCVRYEHGTIALEFADGSDDCVLRTIDGKALGEFTLVWEDGSSSKVPAFLQGHTVTIPVRGRRPEQVRYAWSNAPTDGLLYGSSGLLVAPCEVRVPSGEPSETVMR